MTSSKARGSSDGEQSSGNKKRGQRKRITPEQLAVLEPAFELNDTPTYSMREVLAAQTGMTIREVQVWAQNRRAKKRLHTLQTAEKAREGMLSSAKLPPSGLEAIGFTPASDTGSASSLSPPFSFSSLPALNQPPEPIAPRRGSVHSLSDQTPASTSYAEMHLGLQPPGEARPILRTPPSNHLHLRPQSPNYERPAFLPPPPSMGLGWLAVQTEAQQRCIDGSSDWRQVVKHEPPI